LSPRLTPVSRDEFVRKLKNLGYDGPFKGGDHQYMIKPGSHAVKVPNPHGKQGGGIGLDILRKVLRDSAISRDAWDKA
jgi:predicted RNA binding protein YcfA (HicA-like mRNA interferase family)